MALINDGLPFLTADVDAHGLTPARIRALIRNGAVRSVLRGVAVDAGVKDTRLLRCQALALVCPDGGVVGLSTATWLWGVDTFLPFQRGSIVAQFLVPHHDNRQLRRGVKTIECYLKDDDITELHGVRLTVPNRTTIDLLRRLPRPHALAAADSMDRAGIIDRANIVERAARLRAYPGIRQARALVRMIDGRRESPGESWVFLRIVDVGFPWPEPQVSVVDRHGRAVYFVDLGYKELKIGSEYDGRMFHTDAEREHDDHRREQLRAVFAWRIAVARYESIIGTDTSFEWQLGSWLGIDPLPRTW